jgi:lysophospholipase L1-like esterase
MLAAAILVIAPQTTPAAVVGVIGDSLSDEYAEQDYAYSDNWVEQLAAHRGVDFGPYGAWGEPRRNFHEYNWARYGSTSGEMIADGQHTGLAAQIVPESIEYAVLMIGANDQLFDGNNAYANIYTGAWSPAQINTWAIGVAANINTALSTVLATGVKLVLVNAPDYGVTPWIQSQAPSAAGRQAVADAIANQLNPQIEALAQSYQLPYVDLQGALASIFGPHNALNAKLAIGNVNIQLMQSDTAGNTVPTAAFVHDTIHPHTTLQGVLANLVLVGLNTGYGANLALFSEEEILAHAGIAYGGSDTLAGQIGPYSGYVTNYVPEPSTLVLAACAALGLLKLAHRKRCTK